MLVLLVILAQAVAPSAAQSPVSQMHPKVPLLDAQGVLVRDSGGPLSTMKTCGACHDTRYIAEHSFHALAGADRLSAGSGLRPWDRGPGWFGRWDPTVYALPGNLGTDPDALSRWARTYGLRHPGGGATEALGEEMDCFLCHVRTPDLEAREQALQAGDYSWAATATLAATPLIHGRVGSWAWNRDLFDAEGAVEPSVLGIQAPSSQNCAACHGEVREGEEPLMVRVGEPHGWMTSATGQLFAGQRISDSAMNVRGKDSLSRPWDVHAARLLSCTDCHYSLNDPIFKEESDRSRPAHLRFDARRMDFAAFLQRPLHQFAKGRSSIPDSASEFDDSMRRCESCHDPTVSHDWLPYRALHFRKLACEVCHVPRAHLAGLESLDWTMLDSDRNPIRVWRGLRGSPSDPVAYQEGFIPVLLERREADGRDRLMPYNLLTTWYWLDGSTEAPVARDLLQEALFLPEGGFRPQVMETFDADHDGRIDQREARLDDPLKTDLVRGLLVGVGVRDPHLHGDVEPRALSHGVTGGRFALRDCRSCHSDRSRIYRGMALASYRPAGAPLPELLAGSAVACVGERVVSSHGDIRFQPSRESAELYLFGRDAAEGMDVAGILAVIVVLLAVGVHGGLRVLAKRRQADGGE